MTGMKTPMVLPTGCPYGLDKDVSALPEPRRVRPFATTIKNAGRCAARL